MAHGEPLRSGALTLLGLAVLFLRLGATAFGGPAVHIALMEDEVVRRRGWLSRDEFLDLLGATNLIPGPNSTEMAIHIGHRRAGWPGLLVAGLCFIMPSLALMAAVTWPLAWTAVCDGPTALLALLSATLLFRYRVNSSWLVGGGALLGLLLGRST